MIVRAARPDDADQLGPLHVQVWNESYATLMPPEVLARWSRSPMGERIALWRDWIAAGGVLVAEDDTGRIVGFVSTGPDPDEPAHELLVFTLYVVAALHGSGLGHRLLTAAIGDRPAHLWVFEGNEQAIAFYRRQGFAFDGGVREDPPYGRDFRMVRG